MTRTTIVAEPELLAAVRRLARERGVSMAEFIREAIEDKVRETQPAPRSAGVATSGHPDTARRSGEVRPPTRPWR